MKKLEMAMATTHIDLQGEQLPLEALNQMAECVKTSLIPLTVEHDPRQPPLGRIESAFVRKRDDGAYELVGNAVLFTEDDITLPVLDREMVLPVHAGDKIAIDYDFNCKNPIDQEIFEDLRKETGIESHYIAKKALQPLSVIGIAAGTFVFGQISSALIQKIVSDGYEALKSALKRLFHHRKDGEDEKLLSTEFSVVHNGVRFVVEIIITNPSDQCIDDLFPVYLKNIDAIIAKHFIAELELRKLVYEVKDGELKLRFAIRKDCFPLEIIPDSPVA